MKIRNGFVSNSSSSSFLIGIAKVIDEEKVKKLIEKHKLKYDCEIVDYEGDRIYVESFDGSDVFTDTSYKEGDKVLTIDYIGDEGDDYFDVTGEGDLEYDMDFIDLSHNIVEFIENVTDYVDYFDYTYGAGRNG